MDPAMIARISGSHMQAFIQYADYHALFDLFQQLLKRLLVEKPIDPLAWMADYLRAPQFPSVILIAPPISGVTKICEALAGFLGAVPVSAATVLRTAIEHQTQLGLQSKSYMTKGVLVPDHIMLSLLLSKLSEPNVKTRGYVIDGYPRTKEQALALQRKGIAHDHVFILDVPDDALIERAAQMHIDPVTGSVYDMRERRSLDPSVRQRLVRRSDLSESVIKGKLDIYRRNLVGIKAAYAHLTTVREINVKNMTDHVDEIVEDLTNAMQVRQKTLAPVCIKVVVHGDNTYKRTAVCEMIARKLNCVHVTAHNAFLYALSAKSKLVTEHVLQQYISCPDTVPQHVVIELIVNRLQQSDCQECGWILEAFPSNQADINALSTHKFIPNRVIFLDSSLTVPVKDANSESTPTTDSKDITFFQNSRRVLIRHYMYKEHPFDSIQVYGSNIDNYPDNDGKDIKSEGGYTRAERVQTAKDPESENLLSASSGICQDIKAGDDLARVLERVESAMLRPVEYKFKKARQASI